MLQEPTPSARGNVLFVDDEENITRTLERQFKPLGYNVFIANNGVAALHILANDHIDVVVCDMRMPQMNGASLLKEVATQWPDIGRILLTGFSEVDAAVAAINDGKVDFYLEKPWNENYIEAIVKNAVETKHLKEKTQFLQKEVYRQNQELLSLNHTLENKVNSRTKDLNKTLEDLQQSQLATLNICSNLIDNHIPHYRNHADKVAELARKIALVFNLSETEVNHIHYAAYLYALGKIALPKTMLDTPYRMLKMDTKSLFEQYPIIGATALMANQQSNLRQIAEIILAHRENYNGKGYPHKLSGDNIPLGARILSVAIDYEQLQTGTLLPEKLTNYQAVELIKASKEAAYDPKVVDAFCEVIAKLPKDTLKPINEKIMTPESLIPGMTLSRDLMSSGGMLLLPKNTLLDQKAINNLIKLQNVIIYIQLDKPIG